MSMYVQCPVSSGRLGRQRGVVLIMSMFVLLILASFAVSMSAISSSSLQVADNHHKANGALATATSGMEIMRYLLDDITVEGTVSGSMLVEDINEIMQARIDAAGIDSLTLNCYKDASIPFIFVSPVQLTSDTSDYFYSYLYQPDPNHFRVYVLGYNHSILRTLSVEYDYGETANTVFDYGVATKGPLSLQGNIEITEVNIAVEMNVYIESENDPLALEMQNSQIAGGVEIVNPLATVDIKGGQASVGGATGDAVYDHISIGSDSAVFPRTNASVFESYATNTFDSNTPTNNAVLENIRIPAGTNPKFSGNTVIRGVMFVEEGNVVEFQGGVDITGLIVADGDKTDDSGTNKLIFSGNVGSASVDQLPADTQFDGLREETGTFVMAPGFALSFGGSFSTLSGAIVGNGIEFYGSAGGTINGSVINYADTTMSLNGSSDIFLNRSGLQELPAGFVPEVKLVYDSTSYAEPMLLSLSLN